MAPGYVIAIGFVLAGAAGLVLGLILLRAEQRAKAAGLRSFLTSGNAVRAAPPARWRPTAPRPVVAQRASARRAQPPRASAAPAHAPDQVSDALGALRRAYARGPGGQPA
jgi:hypothetical protein